MDAPTGLQMPTDPIAADQNMNASGGTSDTTQTTGNAGGSSSSLSGSSDPYYSEMNDTADKINASLGKSLLNGPDYSSANNTYSKAEAALASAQASNDANFKAGNDSTNANINNQETTQTQTDNINASKESQQLARSGGFGVGSQGMQLMNAFEKTHNDSIQKLETQRISELQAAKAANDSQNLDLAKQHIANADNLETNINTAKSTYATQANAYFTQTQNVNAKNLAAETAKQAALQKTADDARTNLNTFLTQFGGMDPATLTPDQKSQLAKMESAAGWPPGIIEEGMQTLKQKADDAKATNDAQNTLIKAQTEAARAATAASNGAFSQEDFTNFSSSLGSYNGFKFVTPTDLTGLDTKTKNAYTKGAEAAGYTTISNKDSDALTSIQSASSDLADFGNFLKTSGDGGTPVLPKTFWGQPKQYADVKLNEFLQTNNQLGAFNTWKLSIIPTLTALKGAGSGGGGGAARMFSTIGDLFPTDTDTLPGAQAKINHINDILQNGGNSIMNLVKATDPSGKPVLLPKNNSAAAFAAGYKPRN